MTAILFIFAILNAVCVAMNVHYDTIRVVTLLNAFACGVALSGAMCGLKL